MFCIFCWWKKSADVLFMFLVYEISMEAINLEKNMFLWKINTSLGDCEKNF